MAFTKLSVAFIIAVCIQVFSVSFGSVVTVKTSKGVVQGRVVNSTAVFQGIPYAQPPVGKLRYKVPADMQPWSNVKEMMKYSNWCPQLTYLQIPMGEDCLYLNVFSPSVNGSFPVLVWIHGGGFTTGSGNRFPVKSIIKQIVNKGIVMVTLNYRLNGFGFFATYTKDITGNLGMLDQVKALAWVQKEIRNFGGDPFRVTIDGESAGGASVSLQTYSKLSRGIDNIHSPLCTRIDKLFVAEKLTGLEAKSGVTAFRFETRQLLATGYYSQVIMQSGTALNPWAVDGVYFQSTGSMELAILAGCSTKAQWAAKNFSNLLSCMQAKSWTSLLNLQKNISSLGFFLPIVDGPGGFLEDFPSKIKRPSNFSVMMGSNHDEFGFFVLDLFRHKINMSQINQHFFQSETMQIAGGYFSPNSQPVSQLINYAYVESQNFNMSDYGAWLHASVQLISEASIHAGTVAEAVSLISQNQTVYLYSFDFLSKSLWGSFQYPVVLHFFDVIYLFPGLSDGLEWKFGPQDYQISSMFGSLWSNFVIHGNPTPTGGNLSFLWTPAPLSGPTSFLSLTAQPSMASYFHPRAEGFWNVLLPQMTRSFHPAQPSHTPPSLSTRESSTASSRSTHAPITTTHSSNAAKVSCNVLCELFVSLMIIASVQLL